MTLGVLAVGMGVGVGVVGAPVLLFFSLYHSLLLPPLCCLTVP